ncbi:MAG: hypothetical protein RIQ81_2346 [Pseudomonadota bacterium]|jgi:hypothetical protein
MTKVLLKYMSVRVQSGLALLILTLSVFASPTRAHNGVDHDAPTTVKAPKGGIIKSLDDSKVEVVSKGSSIKIYVYGNDLKPIPATTLKIDATAVMPRSKKSEVVSLSMAENMFEGSYDAKGAHRYTLRLSVTELKSNRTEILTFTIEPRK